MEFPHAKLLVFAKAPVAGQVKTRLIPTLSPEQAAQLHSQLVTHTLTTATAENLCPVELWCANDINHPFFEACQMNFNIKRQQQPEGGLGERMSFALKTALTDTQYAIIIGTDCPTLNTDNLRQAFRALSDKKDAVITPAEDGGYVLIGAKKHSDTLFENIEWGTETVFKNTQQRLEKLNWNWTKLETLWDLDRPEDLVRYKKLIAH